MALVTREVTPQLWPALRELLDVERPGSVTVARHVPPRPIMRYDLRAGAEGHRARGR